MRLIGGTALFSAVAPPQLFGAEGDGSKGVLAEACGFADFGGWILDTQHYHQMGGCYLLAHGMGVPVESAKTAVSLPDAGKWNVWVRTRDWCPGKWQAPGRFKVKIDGSDLEPIFGTEDGWGWQAGGLIDLKEAGSVSVEVEDLTGFEGRFDAIFFTKEEDPALPNNDLCELTAWKERLAGRAELEIKEEGYDLVVVGGGIAGCGAALAAGKEGLKVALIQDRPLFGGNASEEVRVHTIGISAKAEELIKTIDTGHWPNGDAKAKVDQVKREKTLADSGVDLFAGYLAIGLSKEGERITSVEAREMKSGRISRFKAPVFVDATGDGWLGYWAGAEYREGREAKDEFGEGWDKYGDLWSPAKPDNRVMGTSVLWNSERGKSASSFPDVPWATPVANGHRAIKGEWFWEYSADDLDQIDDAEAIRDHLLRAIYGSFRNSKKHPKNAPVKLKFVGFVGGKRESRRLVGDHLYTGLDARNSVKFPDAVVSEEREIDLHYQTKLTGRKQDFISKAMFQKPKDEYYYIPFRSLYSKNIGNLMMAGRCFSCTHVGLGGPRVMKTCGQMGVATGFAAALCKKHSVAPREVGAQHIDELRGLCGYS